MSDEPSPGKPQWILYAIAGGALLAVLAIIVTTVVIWGQGQPEAAKDAVSTSAPTPGQTPGPNPAPTPDPEHPEDEERVFGPDDPEIEGTGPVGPRLEALIERYKQADADGTLWEQIPETEENRNAYVAFLFLLTDMKVAAQIGVDQEDERQYAKQAKFLEDRLLAQEPLGSSVKYTNAEGRVFTYDGDTGESSLG